MNYTDVDQIDVDSMTMNQQTQRASTADQDPSIYDGRAFAVDRYYRELDLPRTATQEEIKSQYKQLVRTYHPDRFPDSHEKAIAEERLKAINEAYRFLSSRAVEGQLVKFMQRELGLVVEPSMIDFGIMERRQQRAQTFHVRFEKEVEGVDFVPSEEDSWFRVGRVSHIYGTDHASLEFEVEVDTTGLTAKTYQGWVDVYLDSTMTRIPLTLQVARRSWQTYAPPRRWLLVATFVLTFILFSGALTMTDVGSTGRMELAGIIRTGMIPSANALEGNDLLSTHNAKQLYFSLRDQGTPALYSTVATANAIPKRLFTGVQVTILQDQQFIAYLDYNADQTQVFLYDRDNDHVHQLTDDGMPKSELAWSNDGHYLAYLVGSEQEARIGLYDIAAEKEYRLPGAITAGVSHYAWSPDGTTLLFDLWRDQERRVYRMTVPAGELQQLTHFDSWGGVWSPDGTEVIVTSAKGLYRLDSSGRQLRQISNEPAEQPRWSADGRWVSYVTQSIGSTTQEQILWLMHPDGTAVQQVAANAVWHEWNPVGATLGYLTGSKQGTLSPPSDSLYYLWVMTVPEESPRLIAEVNEPHFTWER